MATYERLTPQKKFNYLKARRESVFARATDIFKKSAALTSSTAPSFRSQFDRLESLEAEFVEIQQLVDLFNATVEDQTLQLSSREISFLDLVDQAKSNFSFHIKQISPQDESKTTQTHDGLSGHLLPKIPLPIFSGRIEDFVEYYTLFESLIDKNINLNTANKFQYLRQSLTGDASAVIAGFEFVPENYKLALVALKQRYYNKRRLASIYLNRIFNFNQLSGGSHQELQRFITTHENNFSALEKLGVPDLLDLIKLQLALNNLDPGSRRCFEDKYSSDNFPKYDELLKFITQRSRTSELMSEESKPCKAHLKSNRSVSQRQPFVYSLSEAHSDCRHQCKSHQEADDVDSKTQRLEDETKVFILLWIFLQNIVVSFGGNLLAIYYKKAEIRDAHLQKQIETSFYISPEDYCIGGGGIIGGILILILSQSVDIKSHFCAIRCIQIISIGVIALFYKLQNYEWSHDYWTFGIYSIFFMQGAIECMSQVLTPVYIMDTVCDRDLDEPVAFLLLVTTQIPMHISSFCAQLLSVNHLFLTLGVGIFGGIFFLVFLFYIFLPRSFQDGEENEKSEYVDYWHLQFEGESGWLRPAATSIGVCILAEMCGSQIYQFYCPWALRLVHSPISPELLTSAVSFMTLLSALTIWTKERLPYFLMISTATLSLCSFLSGIFLHGLETNGSIFSFAPLSIYILYTIAYSSGLGSLGEIIAVLITPRSYRLNILTIAVVLSFLSQRLSKAVIPTLIQSLHPFGVFWLYSGIVLFGLLYMAVAIVGQLKHRGQASVPGQTTVEEFITQV